MNTCGVTIVKKKYASPSQSMYHKNVYVSI